MSTSSGLGRTQGSQKVLECRCLPASAPSSPGEEDQQKHLPISWASGARGPPRGSLTESLGTLSAHLERDERGFQIRSRLEPRTEHRPQPQGPEWRPPPAPGARTRPATHTHRHLHTQWDSSDLHCTVV